ncbi:MAG: hypothetical protein AABX24_00175 [Nanoarchaeota archaeon]
MTYSWDAELIGDMKERQKATTFHETDFLKKYVKKQVDHKYLTTPKPDDYLTLRQRGSLEGMTESLYRLNGSKLAANTLYARTGTHDIASKLRLYDPATSVNIELYSPKRNPYQKEEEQN